MNTGSMRLQIIITPYIVSTFLHNIYLLLSDGSDRGSYIPYCIAYTVSNIGSYFNTETALSQHICTAPLSPIPHRQVPQFTMVVLISDAANCATLFVAHFYYSRREPTKWNALTGFIYTGLTRLLNKLKSTLYMLTCEPAQRLIFLRRELP